MATKQNLILSTVLVFAVVIILVMSDGNVGAAIAPPLAIAAFFAILRLPLRHTVLAFWMIMLLINNPGHNPAEGKWIGPLTILGNILYRPLHKLTGVPGLLFSVHDVVCFLFLFVILVRTIARNNIDRHLTYTGARPMKYAAFVSIAAVAFATVYGIARGGNSTEAFYQLRNPIWAALCLIVSMRAFKTDKDFRRLGIVLAIVCVAHVVEGIYFYFVYVIPQHLDLQYIMTHYETVWFSILELMLISNLVETTSKKSLFALLTLGGLVMYGIILNDRRLAFVSLAFGMMVIFANLQYKIRWWLIRIVLASIPITGLYFAIGMNSTSKFFSPVHSITSVGDDQDASNWVRNVENYNLIQTLRRGPIWGSGWGHPYDEPVIGIQFSYNYRYNPHNGMLGLFAYTGIAGFFLIFIYMPIGVFYASRVYRNSIQPLHRVTAITAMCMIPVYLVQCYGDTGIWDPDSAIVLVTPLACAANLFTRSEGQKENRPLVPVHKTPSSSS